MAQKQSTQWWITGGCGCCLLLALLIGAVVAAGFFGVSSFKDYLTDLKDPVSRSARTAEILGASRLPEGYVGQVFFSIPWVFDVVILSDGEPMAIAEEDDVNLDAAAVGEHVFIYFKLRSKDMDDEDVDHMLRGEHTSGGTRVDVGIELDPEEEIGRGAFELEPQRLRWVAHRGEIELDDDLAGIYSRVIIDCPTDELTRVAVWFQRDPEEPSEAAADLAGSPADEAALRTFMGHFNVCVD